MTVEQFLSSSKGKFAILFESEDEEFICFTLSDARGIEPYLDATISSWRFPDCSRAGLELKANLIITLSGGIVDD